MSCALAGSFDARSGWLRAAVVHGVGTDGVMSARARLEQLVREWDVRVDRTIETSTSILAFGARSRDRVVLKVVITPTDEWHAGAVTAAFNGHGMVRVYEFEPGAVLMQQLIPGTSSVELAIAHDDKATRALAGVMQEMLEVAPVTTGYPAAEAWGHAFDRYLTSGDMQIAAPLVVHAREQYRELCRTQSSVRLLHGDLQHYNVLADHARGWTAIDPKGVVAELEFELGAALRNPHGQPDLYATRSAVVRRLDCFADVLGIDCERAAAWAYAQAVLSAIWSVEDDGTVDRHGPALRLANALRTAV